MSLCAFFVILCYVFFLCLFIKWIVLSISIIDYEFRIIFPLVFVIILSEIISTKGVIKIMFMVSRSAML